MTTKFIKGNEAVIIGALYAGCDAYFGYPITPASEIAHAAAKWFPSCGREFLQAECETASINMVYGAASAGALAMTATSGPGFSLMQEGVSYMAAAGLPAVVVTVMRAGPGLGNVYPEQADYNQAVKGGGHGSYQCLCLAPANVQEMCDLTIEAFRLSLKHRTPAVVLADGLIGQMMETLALPERMSERPDTTSWSVQGTAETRPNLITSIYLDAPTQEKFNIDLQRKYATYGEDVRSESYLTDDAEIVLIGYGISSRIARTAAEQLRKEGIRAGVFRPVTLNPFPTAALAAALEGRKALAVELSAGQFRDDALMHLARDAKRCHDIPLCHRMGGVVVTVDEVVAAAKKVMGR